MSDFYRHTVYRVSSDGTEVPVVEVAGQPSGLGWLPDGSLLVVSMRDHRLLRRTPEGELSPYADLSEHSGGLLNDLVVDRAGRAWVGNFGFDLMGRGDLAPAVLQRVDPDGSVHVAADGLLFPNGMVITEDGATLVVGETFGGGCTAFTIAADGSLVDRRTWAALGPRPEPGPAAAARATMTVAPDGCCLDAEGAIWVADAMGGRCARVREGVGVVDEIPAPAGLQVFACMLGGDDGRTLLLCAAPDSAEHRRSGTREAVLLTTRVDAPHAGRP